jgi:hypothetical protein
MSGGDAGWAWRSCAFRVAMPGAAGFGENACFPGVFADFRPNIRNIIGRSGPLQNGHFTTPLAVP